MFFGSSCCCDGGPVECARCTNGALEEYIATASGFPADHRNIFNGTFVLTPFSACQWRYTFASPASTWVALSLSNFGASVRVRVTFFYSGVQQGAYLLDVSPNPFDCTAGWPRTLDREAGSLGDPTCEVDV